MSNLNTQSHYTQKLLLRCLKLFSHHKYIYIESLSSNIHTSPLFRKNWNFEVHVVLEHVINTPSICFDKKWFFLHESTSCSEIDMHKGQEKIKQGRLTCWAIIREIGSLYDKLHSQLKTNWCIGLVFWKWPQLLERVDKNIHWINFDPVNREVHFVDTYILDSNLSIE